MPVAELERVTIGSLLVGGASPVSAEEKKLLLMKVISESKDGIICPKDVELLDFAFCSRAELYQMSQDSGFMLVEQQGRLEIETTQEVSRATQTLGELNAAVNRR